MNRYAKRRKNFSIFLVVLGVLIIVFRKFISLAIFGTEALAFLLIWAGGIFFFVGVIVLGRLYFHGDRA